MHKNKNVFFPTYLKGTPHSVWLFNVALLQSAISRRHNDFAHLSQRRNQLPIAALGPPRHRLLHNPEVRSPPGVSDQVVKVYLSTSFSYLLHVINES